MQGHNKQECFILHPHSYPKDEEKENRENKEEDKNKDKLEGEKIKGTTNSQEDKGK